MNVNLFWLVNSSINHASKICKIYETTEDPKQPRFICEKWDDYYKENREELYKRTVYFFSIEPNGDVKVYLRPKGWKQK